MHPRIKLTAELYGLNKYLALKALDEAKPDDLFVRPSEKGNSFHWIFRHVTASRFTLAQAIGLKDEVAWGKLFDMGAEPKEPSAYPAVGEIKKAFLDISDRLQSRFESMTEGDLSGQPPFKIPGIEETIAGSISFMAFHEGYHVGQLAYVLRLHGGDKLVG
jgi:uncharacterized damage-inducible protein DinB